jgi:glycosyltransferase involved in cell wall biosynthesis
MQICLFVPGPLATDTGGHVYDRRMAETLRELGHDVSVVEIPGRLPDPDQAAIYAARTAWSALPENCIRLIDGLALPAFEGLPLHRVAGLIHHPASMETGLPDDIRQRLHATEAEMFQALPRLLVTSEQTADLIARDFAIPRDRIGTIVPGIGDLPRGKGSPGPSCRILSAGALIPRKGHDLLLRALARLFDIDWHLTIAGSPDRDPVHASGLAALATDLNIAQRTEFVPAVTGALWDQADVFALTSHFEGYGIAIAEALRRGIPVAVTNVGAVPALVGPETGVIVSVGDTDQYSKAIRRLIFDETVRKAMAEAAWRESQALPSWRTQAEHLAAALNV